MKKLALLVTLVATAALAGTVASLKTQNLTGTAPVSATDGIALSASTSAGLKPVTSVRLSLKGVTDAGSPSNANNPTGGLYDCYRYTSQLTWSISPTDQFNVIADGGSRSVTLEPKALTVPGDATRFACVPQGITVMSNDGGAMVQTLLEGQY